MRKSSESPTTSQARPAEPHTNIGGTFISSHPFKHGLIAKTLPIADAYQIFLKVGADPEVQKLRRKATTSHKMKNVPALYLVTAMALEGMSKDELERLKLRMAKRRL